MTNPAPAPATYRTDRLFLIGTIAGTGLRGALFLLSFGVLSPGIGYPMSDAISGGHGDIVDLVIAAALVAAGIYGATAERDRRYAYLLGVIFALDVVAYGASIALSYRGQGAPVWLPVTLVGLQVPFLVIAGMLIRRASRR